MAARPNKRREIDVMKLLSSQFEVALGDNENPNDFYVKLRGPDDSPFEKGFFKIHVTLPDGYPYKSPSIGFCTTVFHPNIDERSGSVCLDVINQTWSPLFDLVNVFESFLPQLLQYPNPSDPLNGEAARLALRDPASYESRAREYVQRFASVDFPMNPNSSNSNSNRNSSSSSSSLNSSSFDSAGLYSREPSDFRGMNPLPRADGIPQSRSILIQRQPAGPPSSFSAAGRLSWSPSLPASSSLASSAGSSASAAAVAAAASAPSKLMMMMLFDGESEIDEELFSSAAMDDDELMQELSSSFRE